MVDLPCDWFPKGKEDPLPVPQVPPITNSIPVTEVVCGEWIFTGAANSQSALIGFTI